jgi:hypothetical protein
MAGELLTWATGQLGIPYLWGGRGDRTTIAPPPVVDPLAGTDGLWPSTYFGFDCWGLLSCGVYAVGGPDLRGWWTDKAWVTLEPVAVPAPGVAAFFWALHPTGPNDVEHVELLVEPTSRAVLGGTQAQLGGWKTIGARGGDHTTVTLAMANAQGAQVRYRGSHLQHPRFAGFRRLPVG